LQLNHEVLFTFVNIEKDIFTMYIVQWYTGIINILCITFSNKKLDKLPLKWITNHKYFGMNWMGYIIESEVKTLNVFRSFFFALFLHFSYFLASLSLVFYFDAWKNYIYIIENLFWYYYDWYLFLLKKYLKVICYRHIPGLYN